MFIRPARCGPADVPSSSPGKPRATEAAVGVASSPGRRLYDATVTRNLAEIALIGAFCGQTRAAETIFRSLRLLCPDNPHVEMGMAMVLSLASRPLDGWAVLKRLPVSAGSPSSELVPVCKGLMLYEAGHRAAADKEFSESMTQGGEAADFARALSNAARN